MIKNNFQNYDVIGFDMDFTLFEYDFYKLLQLQWKFMKSYLEGELHYPELPLYEDLKHVLREYYAKCIIDQENGLLLKVGFEGDVLIAFKGYRKLDNEEIKRIYGEEGRIEGFQFVRNNSSRFKFCVDFFAVG